MAFVLSMLHVIYRKALHWQLVWRKRGRSDDALTDLGCTTARSLCIEVLVLCPVNAYCDLVNYRFRQDPSS